MNQPKPSNLPRVGFFSRASSYWGMIVLACMVFALFDMVLGLTAASPPRFQSLWQGIAAGILSSAHVLITLALVGAPIAILIALPGKLGKRLTLRTLVVGALSAWVFLHLNRDTLSGPGIQAHSQYQFILWGFRIAGVLGCFIACIIFAWVARSARWLGLVGVLVAMALLYSNLRVLPGLYPGFHSSLVAIALALLTCALNALMQGKGFSLKLALGLVVLLPALSLGVRMTEVSRSAAGVISRLSPTNLEFSVFSEKWFRKVVAPPEIKLQDIQLEGNDLEAEKKAQEILDQHLPGRGQFNILMIAVDTLRSDHVGFNGYSRNTTPNLDALAAKSWNFRNAYAPFPTSSYTYSAVMNGCYSRATPAYAYSFPKLASWQVNEQSSLAGVLSKAGYGTMAITAFDARGAEDNKWFGSLRGGFEVFNPDQLPDAAKADHILKSAQETLAEKGQEPWFMWTHFMDPHEPYFAHGAHDFGDKAIDRYDAEIAFTDQKIGLLLDHLKEKGVMDRTIVVVYSDHGEEFFEHGAQFHNSNVYNTQIHVPLLIHIPGLENENRNLDTTVSLVDVMPTLLAILGHKDEFRRMGRNLLPLMLDSNRTSKGLAYADHYRMFGGAIPKFPKTVIEGSDKLIWNSVRDTYELYDLAADPGETQNLIGLDADKESRLRSLMVQMDREIDGFHTQGQAPVDLGQEFRAEVEACRKDLCEGSNKDFASVNKLNRLLFDYIGATSVPASIHLGEKGLDDLATSIEAAFPAASSVNQRKIIHFLARFARPVSEDFLVAQLEERKRNLADSARIAMGLAKIGNKKAYPILQATAAANLTDIRNYAIGMAYLGQPEAQPWFFPTVCGTSSYLHLGEMISAWGKLKLAGVTRYVREIASDGLWQAKPVQAHLAKTLAQVPLDSETFWLLARLTQDDDGFVLEQARLALREQGAEARLTPAVSAAVAAERAGDQALLNRAFAVAFGHYRDALQKCTQLKDESLRLNLPLRLRFARYLHLDGKVDEARKIYQSLLAQEIADEDKKIAEKRLQLLSHPATFPDGKGFAAEVSDFDLPKYVRVNAAFPVTLKIKNTGSVAWQGGYWFHHNSLRVSFVDLSGKPVDMTTRELHYYFPEGGVLPGETVEVRMLAISPRIKGGKDVPLTPILSFEQHWGKFPDQSTIFKADKQVIFTLHPWKK